MRFEHSVTRKAVSMQLAKILTSLWQEKNFTATRSLRNFKRWLNNHKREEQKIIHNYTSVIMTDTKRRLGVLSERFENEIFYERRDSNDATNGRKH